MELFVVFVIGTLVGGGGGGWIGFRYGKSIQQGLSEAERKAAAVKSALR